MTGGQLPDVYLDECVDVHIADPLRRRGFRVLTAAEAGMSGANDLEQLEYAATRDLVIISHNGLHFRQLHARLRAAGRSHGGIVILPQHPHRGQLALRAAMMLHWLLTLPTYRSVYVRWGDLQQLLARGYRLPGYDDADIRLAMGQAV